jgi:hypothetical protein
VRNSAGPTVSANTVEPGIDQLDGSITPPNKRPAETTQAVFVLRLRAQRGVDAVYALRRALKYLLRGCGLRCLSVEEERPSKNRS